MSYSKASSDPTPYIVEEDLARLGSLVGAVRAVGFVLDPRKLIPNESNRWMINWADALVEVARVGGGISTELMNELRRLAGQHVGEYHSLNLKTPTVGRFASSIAPGMFCLMLILPKLTPILHFPDPSVVIAVIARAADAAEAQAKLGILAGSVEK